MFHSRIYIALLLCNISLAVFAAAPPQGMEPVAKENLDGTRLRMAEAGASLAAPAPGPEWTWLTPPAAKGRNYMCFNTKSGEGITVSIGELANDMDEHSKQELTSNAKQFAIKSGAKTVNEKFEPSQIPIAGQSWRFSFDVIRPDGRKIAAIFYFIRTTGKFFVTLQSISIDGNDTPVFRKFITDFKLLAPKP